MQITGTQYYSPISPYSRTQGTKETSPASISSENTSAANRSNSSSTINKLATQYESVRSISPPAMRELADKLWKAGELSLHESGILIATPIEVIRSENGTIVEARPVQSTEYKFDYMAEIEGALEWAKTHHEEHKIQTFENILSVLNKLDAAKDTNSVDLMA